MVLYVFTRVAGRSLIDVFMKGHYFRTEPFVGKVTVTYSNRVVAESENAVVLIEYAGKVLDPVYYLSRYDILEDLVKDTSRSTHCPIKGDATYWKPQDPPSDDYFAWSYETPVEGAESIAGLIAFNPRQVTIDTEYR